MGEFISGWVCETGRGGKRGQTVQNQAALYWHKANLLSGWWWWWWWNLLQQPDWCLSQWIWLISLVHRNIKSIYELTEVWQALVKLNSGIETWLAAVEYFILLTKHVEVLFLTDSTRSQTFTSSHCSSSLNNITFFSPLCLQALSQRDAPHRNFFFFDGRKGNGVVDYFGPNWTCQATPAYRQTSVCPVWLFMAALVLLVQFLFFLSFFFFTVGSISPQNLIQEQPEVFLFFLHLLIKHCVVKCFSFSCLLFIKSSTKLYWWFSFLCCWGHFKVQTWAAVFQWERNHTQARFRADISVVYLKGRDNQQHMMSCRVYDCIWS